MTRVGEKVIEINNNIEVNSFSIFGLICNSASEFKCIICFKDIGKDYEQFLVWSKKRTMFD